MGKRLLVACVVLFICLTAWAVSPPSSNAGDFKVLFVGQRTIENQNCIAVTFSAQVDATKDFNRFLKLFFDEQGGVDGAWVLTPKADVAYFTNIEADTKYEVQIRKGLPSADGRKLAENKTVNVRTRKAKAFISFGSKGYILPSELAKGLPVSTMNVQKADIDFFRVKEKYLVDFISLFNNGVRMGYYRSDHVQRYAIWSTVPDLSWMCPAMSSPKRSCRFQASGR